MAVEKINVLETPPLELGHSKKVLFGSDHFHTWIHGDWPGTKGPMHKHSADQFFYCAQGQCTFHHPDGVKNVINPGEMMVVPKDHYYQLDNTGDVYMVLIGARAEAAGNPRHGLKDEVVGDNDYALKHRDKIRVGAGVKG